MCVRICVCVTVHKITIDTIFEIGWIVDFEEEEEKKIYVLAHTIIFKELKIRLAKMRSFLW